MVLSQILHQTRRKYQEKRHLVKNHEQTESLLTHQATELMVAASTASSDTYRLHDTIARRQIIDRNIESARDKLQSSVQERLLLMTDTVKSLTLSNTAHSQQLIQDMCKL